MPTINEIRTSEEAAIRMLPQFFHVAVVLTAVKIILESNADLVTSIQKRTQADMQEHAERSKAKHIEHHNINKSVMTINGIRNRHL